MNANKQIFGTIMKYLSLQTLINRIGLLYLSIIRQTMSKYAITIYFSFFFSSIFLPILNGQFIYLNKTDQDIIALRLLRNKKVFNNNPVEPRGDENLFVPVKFTVFYDSENPSELKFYQILDALCDLNQYYKESGIQFFLKDLPDFIVNSTVLNAPLSQMSTIELAKLKDNNALNVFITSNANLSDKFQHVTAYYSPVDDWVVIQEKEIFRRNSHFLAHEIGHYFSLLHTFNGWESQPFSLTVHGERAGLIAPDGSTLSEHTARDQCEFEGDYICDTPPDYNFGFGWIKKGNTCYLFDETVYDPAGEQVSPDQNNIMGYFLGCESYHFSPIQQTLMQIDYMSSDRAAIRSHSEDKLVVINQIPLLLKPLNGERLLEPDITLEWEPVEGATSYYVIIESPSQPNKILLEDITHLNTIQINNIENGNYLWKVKPFNSTFVCSAFSPIGSFSIDNSLSVSAQQPNDVQIKLIPNLMGTNSLNTTLYISGNQSIDLNVDIFDFNGRLVNKVISGERIPGGDNSIQMQLDKQLPGGIYLVKIYSYEFQKTLKLIIQ